jgi:hypothetical protein
MIATQSRPRRPKLDVRPKDLDLERGTVRVLYGKGGKSRTAGIDAGGAWPRSRRDWLRFAVSLFVSDRLSGLPTCPLSLDRGAVRSL